MSVCLKFKALCIRTAKTLREPSLYIKIQDIGTGRSETVLIIASQVLIFRCFLIFEQTSRNLALSQIIAKLLILSFKQEPYSEHLTRRKVREFARSGLNIVRSQILICNDDV